jgi:hypothetical protein
MDGSGLMESLFISIKPLHVAVASLTVKLQIFANSAKLPKLQIIEMITALRKFVDISDICTFCVRCNLPLCWSDLQF